MRALASPAYCLVMTREDPMMSAFKVSTHCRQLAEMLPHQYVRPFFELNIFLWKLLKSFQNNFSISKIKCAKLSYTLRESSKFLLVANSRRSLFWCTWNLSLPLLPQITSDLYVDIRQQSFVNTAFRLVFWKKICPCRSLYFSTCLNRQRYSSVYHFSYFLYRSSTRNCRSRWSNLRRSGSAPPPTTTRSTWS